MATTSLAPMRHRAFAMLWVGAFISNIGNWMETITVGIYVTDATGKSLWTGLVAAAAFIPNALLGPIGGALADRLPRKTLLLVTNALQTVFAGALAYLIGGHHASPLLVVLMVFGAGCVGSAGFPAYQAILPDLVPTEDVPAAVALSATQWNLGRVIGPAAAGIAIALGGYTWALGINTVSFFAPIIVITIIAIPRPKPRAPESLLASMRAGLRFAKSEPAIRTAMWCLTVTAFLAAPFIALVPAISELVLHAEKHSHGTAWLVAAQGAGAVTAGLLLGSLTSRWGNRVLLGYALRALPIALLAYALAPNLPAAVVAIFFVGGVYLTTFASLTTVAQLRAPSELRGRVLSVFMVVLGLLYPIGAALEGRLGDTFGLRVVTATGAVLYGVIVYGTRIVRPRFLDPIGDNRSPHPLPPELVVEQPVPLPTPEV